MVKLELKVNYNKLTFTDLQAKWLDISHIEWNSGKIPETSSK